MNLGCTAFWSWCSSSQCCDSCRICQWSWWHLLVSTVYSPYADILMGVNGPCCTWIIRSAYSFFLLSSLPSHPYSKILTPKSVLTRPPANFSRQFLQWRFDAYVVVWDILHSLCQDVSYTIMSFVNETVAWSASNIRFATTAFAWQSSQRPSVSDRQRVKSFSLQFYVAVHLLCVLD